MKIQPKRDYVLLIMAQKAQTSAGGIVLPEQLREYAELPKVVAVGPGRRNDLGERVPLDLEVGDIVMTDPNINPENRLMEADGTTAYFLFREHEIIATIDPALVLAKVQ